MKSYPMADWLPGFVWDALVLLDAVLLLAAVLCVLRICWDVYKLRTRRQSLIEATQDDVARIVASHLAKGRRVFSVTHVGKGVFLLVVES